MTIPDFTIGYSQEELEEMLEIWKGEQKKVIASYSESGTQVIKRKLEDIGAMIAGLQRALQMLDPDRYGSRRRAMSTFVSNNLSK